MISIPAPFRRLHDSAAYRSAYLYRWLVDRLPSGSPGRSNGTEALPLTFLTFGGAAHRSMLRECLLSLRQSWPGLPRVRVASDGSLDMAQVRRDLKGWTGEIEVTSWRELTASLDAPRFASLLRFAERDAMGRKMACVVASALQGPTLYCDVDLLWFRYPRTLDALLAESGPTLALSPDCRPSYDDRLVPSRLPALGCAPYYCAGLLFAYGDFLAACEVSELLEFAAREGIGVTEQTTLAEACRQLGGRSWPQDEIALFEDDRTSLGPSFRRQPWAARHYVGPVRHLFWRDALALRLGLRP